MATFVLLLYIMLCCIEFNSVCYEVLQFVYCLLQLLKLSMHSDGHSALWPAVLFPLISNPVSTLLCGIDEVP